MATASSTGSGCFRRSCTMNHGRLGAAAFSPYRCMTRSGRAGWQHNQDRKRPEGVAGAAVCPEHTRLKKAPTTTSREAAASHARGAQDPVPRRTQCRMRPSPTGRTQTSQQPAMLKSLGPPQHRMLQLYLWPCQCPRASPSPPPGEFSNRASLVLLLRFTRTQQFRCHARCRNYSPVVAPKFG